MKPNSGGEGPLLLAGDKLIVLGENGEVALVGVVPEARGIGLGRALLRWGVSWIEAREAGTVELLVDGENDGALALYLSEGFVVTETREVWRRAPL